MMRLDRRVPEAFGFGCLLAALAFVPVMLNVSLDLSAVISKVYFMQAMACLALGAVLAAGTASWRGLAGPMRWALGACAVLLVVAMLSAALSGSWWEAFDGEHLYREGLATWIAYVFFFIALVLLVQERPDAARTVLDVMLLASVAPVAYGFMQVSGLDVFLFRGATDVRVRPNSTLGNALWFAGYVALLAPLSGMRAWMARGRPAEAALWVVLAVAQLGALWLTQSRGSTLALVAACLFIAAFAAAWRRSRALLAAVLVGVSLVVAFIAAINLVPPLRDAVKPLPTVGRLVVGLDRFEGRLLFEDNSAAIRIGLWRTGVQAFAEAPLVRKLVGNGPELGWERHSRYLPPLLMQADRYTELKRYPRLHADILDMLSSFGLLGWLAYASLFVAALHAALRAMFGLPLRRSVAGLVGSALVGGVVAAALSVAVDLSPAIVPAFGLGMAGGWFLWLAWLAWGAVRSGLPAAVSGRVVEWVMLAALVASLLAFWVDSQINNPAITPRLVLFAVLALVFCAAARLSAAGAVAAGRGAKAKDAEDAMHASGDASWPAAALLPGIALCTLAALLAFVPTTQFTTPHPGGEVWHWLRLVMPFAASCAVGAWLLHVRGWRAHGSVREHLVLLVALPLACVLVLRLLAVPIGDLPSMDNAGQVAAMGLLPFVFALLLAAGWAFAATRLREPSPAAAKAGRSLVRGAVVLVALVLAVVAQLQGHAAMLASAAHTMAGQALAQARSDLAVRFYERAVAAEPYSRAYRQDLVQAWLAVALAGMGKLDKAPAAIRDVDVALTAAEAGARPLAMAHPDDPGALLQLANVLQVWGLRALRPLTGQAGVDAAEEARVLFSRAQALFPSQPLILAQWAQFEFDQQRYTDAAVAIDLMEGLIPFAADAYELRISLAQQVGDRKTVADTLARAAERLDEAGMGRLRAVAKIQQ